MNLINQMIRDYKVISKIGEGGMGEVYLAEDIMLGRKVALKVLNPALTKDPAFTERFRQEARVQATLQHPNITSLYAFIQEGDNYYMVMELSSGITLKEEIKRRGPLPFTRVKKILLEVLEALSYAHQKGIIHRDIKPSNIMISEGDHIKIMDFGIAKILSDTSKTRTGSMVGSIHYMSPEQIRGDKDIDQRTDIYSLGMTLYEMLSGKLPFDDSTASEFEIMTNIVGGKVPDPREAYPFIPDDMITLYRSMVAKEKTLRIKTCREAIEFIKKIEEPEEGRNNKKQADPEYKAATPKDIKTPDGNNTKTEPSEKPKSRVPAILGISSVLLISSIAVYFLTLSPQDKKVENLITVGKLSEARSELKITQLTPEQKNNYERILSVYEYDNHDEIFAALSEMERVDFGLVKTKELRSNLAELKSQLEKETIKLSSAVNAFLYAYTSSLVQNNLGSHMSLFCDEAYSFDNSLRSRPAIMNSKKKFFSSYTTTRHKFKLLSVVNKGENILAVTADERHWTTKNSDKTERVECVKKYFELKNEGGSYRVFREYNIETFFKVSPVEAFYNGDTFRKTGNDFSNTQIIIKNKSGAVVYKENVPHATFYGDDYDNDSDMELLVLKYSGGMHCCYSMVIYELEGTFEKASKELDLGDLSFLFTDADNDGDREFVTANRNYAYAFSSFASSFFPPLVYEYVNNAFYDRTTNYQSVIREDLVKMQNEISKYLNELAYPADCASMENDGWGNDYRSLVAALVTDFYLLEGEAKAYEILKERYPCNDQAEFWSKIKDLLATYGKTY